MASTFRLGFVCINKNPNLPKHVLELLARDDGIPAATLFSFVKVDTGIAKAGVFVSFELVNSILHEGVVEHSKRDKEIKVFHRQPGHALGQFQFQSSDDIFQALLSKIRDVHEGGSNQRRSRLGV